MQKRNVAKVAGEDGGATGGGQEGRGGCGPTALGKGEPEVQLWAEAGAQAMEVKSPAWQGWLLGCSCTGPSA